MLALEQKVTYLLRNLRVFLMNFEERMSVGKVFYGLILRVLAAGLFLELSLKLNVNGLCRVTGFRVLLIPWRILHEKQPASCALSY